MVRTAEVILNSQNGSKMLAVGLEMANDAGLAGVVTELLWYPSSSVVIATITRHKRGPDGVIEGISKHALVQGEMVAEVL